jgi:hypothetical protein
VTTNAGDLGAGSPFYSVCCNDPENIPLFSSCFISAYHPKEEDVRPTAAVSRLARNFSMHRPQRTFRAHNIALLIVCTTIIFEDGRDWIEAARWFALARIGERAGREWDCSARIGRGSR